MKYVICCASMLIILSGCHQKTYYMMMQDYQKNKNTQEAIRQGVPVPSELPEQDMPSYEEYERSIQNSKF